MTRGTTLVELVVSLAVLGLMAGMTGLAIHSLKPRTHSAVELEIVRARREALEQGRPVRLIVDSAGAAGPGVILFLPDGRVMKDQPGESQ